MSGVPTVAAVILTLNEERNIGELLRELHWFDEIVVVDSGSRDLTVQVAKSHGCTVVSREFDSFANQRNHAASLAKSDWILSIDADERPTSHFVSEMKSRINDPRYSAWRIPIRSSIFGRKIRRSGTQDDNPIRLFRRRSASWIGDVHEVLKVDGRVGHIQSWFNHSTIPDLETFFTKMHRYTMLESNARVSAGRRPRRSDAWISPCREVLRRLFIKHGLLDGPTGWLFCFLSGVSEWVLSNRHSQLWKLREVDASAPSIENEPADLTRQNCFSDTCGTSLLSISSKRL